MVYALPMTHFVPLPDFFLDIIEGTEAQIGDAAMSDLAEARVRLRKAAIDVVSSLPCLETCRSRKLQRNERTHLQK